MELLALNQYINRTNIYALKSVLIFNLHSCIHNAHSLSHTHTLIFGRVGQTQMKYAINWNENVEEFVHENSFTIVYFSWTENALCVPTLPHCTKEGNKGGKGETF